ncbi:MAG: dihydrofolate reductase [Candidatus Falkowbacteria bacterium]|nr:dihydrofolate reductase [Candidatus Falkowbacteria bacterium]
MIAAICAVGKNRGIGYQNKLLWHISDDLKHFKAITTGHVVIMGKNTYLSMGKPLPNRFNIVIAAEPNFIAPGCEVVHSIPDAIKLGKAQTGKDIFIIGGGQIYAQTLPFVEKLYLTLVDNAPEADTFFPDYSEFKNIISEEEHEQNGLHYKFVELTR